MSDGQPAAFAEWPADMQLLYLNLIEQYRKRIGQRVTPALFREMAVEATPDAIAQTIEDAGGIKIEENARGGIDIFVPLAGRDCSESLDAQASTH